jgi:hypothetical protein
MKPGDIVRFRSSLVTDQSGTNVRIPVESLGILIEYRKWEKIASVLVKGSLMRVRAENIEKAGKADGV